MKQEEALNVIKQLAQSYRGTLAEHDTIQKAIAVLTPKEENKDKK